MPMAFRTGQLSLFQNEGASNGARGNGTCFSDPAFASNKTLSVHRWVPWIAGFSSDFVRDAFDRHLRPGGVVLDPFAGVGTTLVEAILRGHDAVGFEINPYAALACRVKTTAHRLEDDALMGEIRQFQSFYQEQLRLGRRPNRVPPSGFKTRAPFYSPKVMAKVLLSLEFIDAIQDSDTRHLFRLAFSSTMVQYSNYSYEPSLGRRVSAGKNEIEDFPVGETIAAKLREMAEDIRWFRLNLPDDRVQAQVFNGSFFGCREHLRPGSIDLVVTSPPYLNNYHYNRNTRPQLYWLGYVSSPADLRHLELDNFGKYWQTVREQENLELNFTLPDSSLTDKLRELRAIHGEKGVYGGNGWANYAASYFNDCLRFAEGLSYALRPGGTALVVIGNSILQGVLIPTDQYFAKIAERAGLEAVEVHVPRATRVGSSIIKSGVRVEKAAEKHQLYEAVVELRRR